MANLVYNMVCDAFADLISRRAAENLVKEALKDIGSHPDRVTALEMQELLRKGIFKRLQKIIPVMKAKGEIKRLLRNLEKTLAQPTGGAEDSEDWDEPDAEAVDLSPWEVQTSLGRPEATLASLPLAVPAQPGAAPLNSTQLFPAQPIRLEAQAVGVSASPSPNTPASNATGLDFLAVPLGPEPVPPERPIPFDALSPSSLPASAATPSQPVLPRFTVPEASSSPVARRDGVAAMPTEKTEQRNERTSDPLMTPPEHPSSTAPSVETAPFPEPPSLAYSASAYSASASDPSGPDTLPDESELVPATQEAREAQEAEENEENQAEENTVPDQALEFDADLFGDAGDLFEFEATDLAALSGLVVPLEPKPALREYKRQDAILSRIALENGVSNVMLSLRSGEVLHARVNRAEPRSLAAAVAHAARPVEGGVAPGLFYADLDDSLILVAPLDDQVLLSILAASSTNIGRLLAEIIVLKEEL